MCEAVGHPVVRLVRTRIGPLADRRLAPGEWRPLTIDEVRALERAAVGTMPLPCEQCLLPCEPCAPRPRSTATSPSTSPSAWSRCSRQLFERNDIDHDDIISILFTATDDIHSMFPPTAARKMGLGDVPLICAQEIDVIGGTRHVHPRHAACHVPTDRAASSTTSTSKARGACATTFRSEAVTAARANVVGTGLIGGSIGLRVAPARRARHGH